MARPWVIPTRQLANASARDPAPVGGTVRALTQGTASQHRILLVVIIIVIIRVPGLPPWGGETEASTRSCKARLGVPIVQVSGHTCNTATATAKRG